MKKFVLGICALLIAGTAFSQVKARAEIKKEKTTEYHDRVAEELNLTPTQKSKLAEIHDEERKAMMELRKERREVVVAKRESLKDKRAALKEDKEAMEAEKARLKAEQEAYKAKLKSTEELYRSKVKSVLTEEQYEEYLLMKGRQQGKKMSKPHLKPAIEEVSGQEDK